MKLLKAMAIAFSIYSKIPVPQFEWKEEDMEYMMCFFPWIGGVIGLFFFGWAVLCEKFAVGNVCYALIGAAIPLMISGGFHVDGYMDTMDAFHSYQSREKKLEILKDSHIGAFAAIMLALYYMIDIAAISELHPQKAVSALVAVFFLARCFSGIAVMTLQPAKKEGTHCRTSLCIYQIGFESPEVFRALLNYTTKQAFFTGFDRCCISCFFDMILIVFSNILSQIVDIHRQKCYLIQDGSLRAVRRCRQDLRTYE